MQFEIKREDLLKLKQTNYDLYQLILSQKSLDGDYCETLDKEKLAKECELGYFKIDELFTKEQIANAYKNIEKRVEAFAGKVLKAYSMDATDFVRGGSFHQGLGASDTPIAIKQKKHARLFEEINASYKDIFIEIENAEQYKEMQDFCFGHGIFWFSSGKAYLDFIQMSDYKNIKIGFRDMTKKFERCIYTDFAANDDALIYDFKTERFI